MRRTIVLAMFALALCASNGWGDMNQFWLAAQHDWGGKRGFFLNLHSDFPAGSKASLDALRLTLGVGDGSEWHVLAHPEKWQLDKPYKAKAVITVDGTDTIAVRTKGMLSLAFDHRIVDGADADRFMADVKKTLQEFPEAAV